MGEQLAALGAHMPELGTPLFAVGSLMMMAAALVVLPMLLRAIRNLLLCSTIGTAGAIWFGFLEPETLATVIRTVAKI